MPFVLDQNPSGSILATGGSIKCILLSGNGRTPITYTITLGTAAVAGATVLTVTSISPAPTATAPLTLEDGYEIEFGAGRIVTTRSATLNQPFQTFVTGGAGTLQVEPLTATNLPAASAVGTTMGLLELLGVQSQDLSTASNLISIRSQKSGLGNEQRNTMTSYSTSISGWVHQRAAAMNQVIRPAALQSREIFLQYYRADGRVITGAAVISDLNETAQLDDVVKMSFTASWQGLPSDIVLVAGAKLPG